ncbi:50S ribosomal protein L23 [Candidatus Saccharibacteria bacterium]|nr:50S ribosomal protein L23 [Candidatus Saccharibacteria bacterium]
MAKDTTVKTTVKADKADKKAKKESKGSKIVLNLLQPRATEKTYLEQAKHTYAFFVTEETSKQAVKARVEKDYNVKVTDVRILTRKGKKCRFSRGKHAYPGTAFRRNRKLAYVTLAEGNSIKVFESPEDKKENKKVSAKEAKAVKKTAKADKKADKENK